MRDVERWRSNLQVEIDGVAIYRSLARAERDRTVAAAYRRLALAESRHARFWARKLRDASAWRGLPRPSWRAALLIAFASRFGGDVVARSVAAREAAERERYEHQDDPETARLTDEERAHASVLAGITREKLSGTGMARLGNALRAAVLGMNDGLVANLSLVMGVAGAGGTPHEIVVAGLAGLLAGSLSMALGEYLSVQTSRELFERQLLLEREADTSFEPSRRASSDDEIGDLGGSAWIASATSFGMFAAGAAVSLIPFAVTSGYAAQLAAVALTGAVLFANGAVVTLVTGRQWVGAGLRQVAIGYAAAAITYGLGRLFNVAFG